MQHICTILKFYFILWCLVSNFSSSFKKSKLKVNNNLSLLKAFFNFSIFDFSKKEFVVSSGNALGGRWFQFSSFQSSSIYNYLEGWQMCIRWHEANSNSKPTNLHRYSIWNSQRAIWMSLLERSFLILNLSSLNYLEIMLSSRLSWRLLYR